MFGTPLSSIYHDSPIGGSLVTTLWLSVHHGGASPEKMAGSGHEKMEIHGTGLLVQPHLVGGTPTPTPLKNDGVKVNGLRMTSDI